MEDLFKRNGDISCAYYCGDEDCDKCTKYGILIGDKCRNCRGYKSMQEYSKEILKEWEE